MSKQKSPKTKTPKGYTPNQAATILHLSPHTIRKALRNGELKATKVSGKWHINTNSFKALLRKVVKATPEAH